MGPRPAAPDVEAAGTEGASIAARPLPACAAASAGPAARQNRRRQGGAGPRAAASARRGRAPWRPADRPRPGCCAPARAPSEGAAAGGGVKQRGKDPGPKPDTAGAALLPSASRPDPRHPHSLSMRGRVWLLRHGSWGIRI